MNNWDELGQISVGTYLFKVNNGDTRTMCAVCSKVNNEDTRMMSMRRLYCKL